MTDQKVRPPDEWGMDSERLTENDIGRVMASSETHIAVINESLVVEWVEKPAPGWRGLQNSVKHDFFR